MGTVVDIDKGGNTVDVYWDNGFKNSYRVGYQSACDLRVFDTSPACKTSIGIYLFAQFVL